MKRRMVFGWWIWTVFLAALFCAVARTASVPGMRAGSVSDALRSVAGSDAIGVGQAAFVFVK